MRSREEIEKELERNNPVDNGITLGEILLDIRDLLQTLVRGKAQHTVVVKGKGKLTPEDIAKIQKTVKDAQAEGDVK